MWHQVSARYENATNLVNELTNANTVHYCIYPPLSET